MGLLPTKKTTVKTLDPKNLIIFGLPKVGKTTSLSMLKDALIVDLEDGTNYIDGYVIKAKKYAKLHKICKALKEEKHNFKFVVIDTISALEEMALDLAARRYREAPVGKNWDGDNVLKLPNGSGFYWQRIAVNEILKWFKSTGLNIILVGHVKDKLVTEGGTELNVKALDLAGKLGNIISADSDAICFVYRDPQTGNLMANFGDENAVISGTRIPRLSGKTIVLTEKKDGQLVSHWDEIYPSLNESNMKLDTLDSIDDEDDDEEDLIETETPTQEVETTEKVTTEKDKEETKTPDNTAKKKATPSTKAPKLNMEELIAEDANIKEF